MRSSCRRGIVGWEPLAEELLHVRGVYFEPLGGTPPDISTIEVLESDKTEHRIALSTSGRALLIFNETFDSGWQLAPVDGSLSPR